MTHDVTNIPWTALLALGCALHFVPLSVWVVLQKRAPVSTIGWILSLALLPVLGFVIYYFFGPQRLKK